MERKIGSNLLRDRHEYDTTTTSAGAADDNNLFPQQLNFVGKHDLVNRSRGKTPVKQAYQSLRL